MVKTYFKKENQKLSENFTLREFHCKCSRCSTTMLDERLVQILQQLRHHFNVPIRINSGYRCKEHNAEVGGVSNSAHMRGMAADIYVTGIAPKVVAQYAEQIGVGCVGLYEDFVHFGSAEEKRFWLGHEGILVDTFGESAPKVTTISLPVLHKGMENAAVKALQALLGVTQDGNFGAKTDAAVRKFQREQQLIQDGICGPATWAKLLGV